MKAFIIERYGSKNGGHIAEVPEPTLRADDVLIQIKASSINMLDVKLRQGEFRLILPYRLPLILGNDLAGVVVSVGADVQRFQPGDEVYARPDRHRIGTFAHYIAVNQHDLAHKPGNISMEEAASLPLVSLTAWQVLVETAKLKKGQKVLIHAGSGGVGNIAIQLAKHLGAYVATTTSAANATWVKALGADVVIDYKSEDFSTLLQDYDVVLNSLGNDVLEKSLKVLKPGGQLISISGPPTPSFATALGLSWGLKQVMRLLSFRIRRQAKRRGVRYAFVFMRASGEQLSEIGALVESGVIQPVVDRVFPLAETDKALAYVETGRAKGKVVVRV